MRRWGALLLLLSTTVLADPPRVVGDWYRIEELGANFFHVHEPLQVSFFVLREGRHALFIDSGLGLSDDLADRLLEALEIDSFDVLLTHAHCDHVGLNYRARRVYVSRKEWDKYLAQNEAGQLTRYHELFRNELPWPRDIQTPPRTVAWHPTDFIDLNQPLRIGSRTFEVYPTPGHSLGHLAFLERDMKAFFTGDLVYDGAMYLHLPDSSLQDFEESLARVDAVLAADADAEIVLYPSHNSVPLPRSYVAAVRAYVERLKKGDQTLVTGYSEPNAMFCAGILTEADGISIIVTDHAGGRRP